MMNSHNIEEIYFKYHKVMISAAYSILGKQDQAEDAVQNAFERLIKYSDKVLSIPEDELKPFLIIISKNCARTLLKNLRQGTVLYIDDLTDELIDSNNTEEHALSQPGLSPLYDLMNRLADNYRELMVLRYYYDLTESDIAKLLNITEENVRVRVHRAKAKLREMFDKEVSR